ncbi:hypothetical protein TTHERM_02223810 (macronuclear) [Tetrahymena thermophila SB210]|uniref:Uncharacterized protein n=1 Tax=Tetrahymena thermophila (strain SB210) TaxID=312017 RepID=Q225L9_TETTS|nr:hypothetical protein TTHERM_02223810 [Tetrahymena thermophila SB210]EAR80985.2 hypothetical protein TTHERM_02223810 [Tetrahymena thermophila SB210]|eukprot:XP_001028648.2 hypothetical protein TTHERM_02223810 [Tetrahymena thermophila SB210]
MPCFCQWKHFDKYQKAKKGKQKIKTNSLESNQQKIILNINEKQPHDNKQNTIDLDFNTPKNSEIAFINLKNSPDFYKSAQNIKSLNSSIQSPIRSTRHIMPSYQKSNFQNLQNQEQNTSLHYKKNVEEFEQKPIQKTIEDKKETQSIHIVSEIASISDLNLEENTQVNQMFNVAFFQSQYELLQKMKEDIYKNQQQSSEQLSNNH